MQAPFLQFLANAAATAAGRFLMKRIALVLPALRKISLASVLAALTVCTAYPGLAQSRPQSPCTLVEGDGCFPSAAGGFGRYENLLADSETIGGTGWTLVNGETALQGAATSPNLDTTASRLANGGTASGAATQTITTYSAAGLYVLTFWAEAGNSSTISFGIWDATSNSWLGGSPASQTLNSTWQRYVLGVNSPSAGDMLVAYIFADGSGSTAAGSYNYVWGAQVTTQQSGAPYEATGASADPTWHYGAVINGMGRDRGRIVVGTPNVTNANPGPCTMNGPIGGVTTGAFYLTGNGTAACGVTISLPASPNGWTCEVHTVQSAVAAQWPMQQTIDQSNAATFATVSQSFSGNNVQFDYNCTGY